MKLMLFCYIICAYYFVTLSYLFCSADLQCQFPNINGFVKDRMEIHREEENFNRVLKLVYNEIPAQLRSFFKDKWKSKFNQDWDDSPTSGNTLLSKIPAKTKSWLKWNKETITKIKEGSSQEWDCSILFQVLENAGISLVACLHFPTNSMGSVILIFMPIQLN